MRLRSLLPLALCSAATISTATAAVVTFDDLSGGPIFGGELVTNQYAGLGATFTDTYAGGAHANNTLTSQIGGSSPPNVLWINQSSGALSGQYLEVDFSIPVLSVSTVFGTSLGADITLSAYNGATLLGSVNTVGGTVISDSRSGQVGITTAQDITSIHLYSHPVGGSTSYNFDIDNLTFSVPEPGVMSWLGLGWAAIWVRCCLLRRLHRCHG